METNKIIAVFMGVESYPFRNHTMFIFDEDNHRTEIDLHYHDSWDWLMPVVEKIESMGFDVNILNNGTQIIDYSKNIEVVNNVADISFDRKIEHTYQAIVRFVSEIRD